MSRRRSTPPAPSARDDDPTRPGWDLSDVDEVDYHGAAYRWSADVDHEMVGDVLDQRPSIRSWLESMLSVCAC